MYFANLQLKVLGASPSQNLAEITFADERMVRQESQYKILISKLTFFDINNRKSGCWVVAGWYTSTEYS